jgi:hypothetical protein
MSFLLNLASKFLPSIAGLASRAIPAISSAIAVGKNVLPHVASAVGKAQQAYQTAKAVGKGIHSVGKVIAPELTQKVEDTYNKKMVGNKSIADVVNYGERGLAGAANLTNQAKGVFANLPS